MSDTANESRRVYAKHAARLLFIFFAIALIYSRTLSVPFIWDDTQNISLNPLIRDMHYFADLKLLESQGARATLFFARRYVGFLTFAMNYRLNGLDVRGYHVVNILIHMATASAVYLLTLLLMQTPRVRGSTLGPFAIDIAFGVALLFAVHPLQTQAVTYIVQRFASLAALFYISSLAFYAFSRMSQRKLTSYGALAASVLCAVLAMKTKEHTFTLPFAAVLIEFVFFEGSFKKNFWSLVPLLCTLPIVPYTIFSSDLWGQSFEGATRLETTLPRHVYFFTQIPVILTYIGMLFLPIRQNIDHQVKIYYSAMNAPVILSTIALMSLVLLAIYLISRGRRGGDGVLLLPGFGILFFFLALSVESSVFPIADLMFEHRVYLPSVGAAIAVSVGLCSAFVHAGKFVNPSRAMLVIVAAIALLLAAATVKRNELWRTEIGIWQDAVSKSPLKPTAQNGLGCAYYLAGKLDESIAALTKAVELNLEYAEAHGNLGIAYIKNAQWEKGIKHILISLELGHETPAMQFMLSEAYKNVGLEKDAKRALDRTIELDPQSYGVIKNMGGG